MNDVLTYFSVVDTILLAVMIIFLLKFKRSIPDIQQVLNDVGSSVSEQFVNIFEKPAVNRAMSVLGKKSGEVRTDKALVSKAANAIIEQLPAAGFVLDQLGMTPEEGIRLLRDPMIGPFIQNMLAQGSGSLKNLLGNFGAGGGGGVPVSKTSDNPFEVK